MHLHSFGAIFTNMHELDEHFTGSLHFSENIREMSGKSKKKVTASVEIATVLKVIEEKKITTREEFFQQEILYECIKREPQIKSQGSQDGSYSQEYKKLYGLCRCRGTAMYSALYQGKNEGSFN